MNKEVQMAIDSERAYQDSKHYQEQHTIGEWLLIMEKVLQDAKRAWFHESHEAMKEIRQVVAVGVAAMEQHGSPLRPGCLNCRSPLGTEHKASCLWRGIVTKLSTEPAWPEFTQAEPMRGAEP